MSVFVTLVRHHLSAPALSALRALHCSPARLSDAIATPPLDGAPKQYSPKIQQLVNDIASLTLLEVSDLNELLKVQKRAQSDAALRLLRTDPMPPVHTSLNHLFISPQKTLNIQDVGMMPMGAMAAATGATAAPVRISIIMFNI